MAFTIPGSISAEQLLDQQTDLLLLADLQGGLKFANRAALQFWGVMPTNSRKKAFGSCCDRRILITASW